MSATFDERNCKDVDGEVFFPLETDIAGLRRAAAICKGCPALQACLEFAMTTETGTRQYRHGVFGGLTPRQRYNLDRERAA